MERLYILIAVLDGNAIAEADAFGLVILEPLGCLAIDEEPLILDGS